MDAGVPRCFLILVYCTDGHPSTLWYIPDLAGACGWLLKKESDGPMNMRDEAEGNAETMNTRREEKG